ncbi:MAG: hypothetical protein KatS3mg071_0393 [Meiothermus sp.]|nr:MAG: hypothetical protein KatS3mg071_0393 [Meiothermus sp.]
MPKTLNPQNTFPTNIPNFPISGNNEPIAIEPLENAIQAVLNRSENLHVRLSEAETQGVKRVRTVASLAALSAATGFNNGDVCDVEGYGRYRLYNPSGLTADGLWVLNAAGGGRWVHTLRDMRGAGNGLATLDSGGRLSQDVRDGSIVTAHLANGSVTAAKLASGAAVANIGYTPVNKAGDTITGDLTVNGISNIGGRTFRKVSFVPTDGVGWYRIIANTNVFGGRLDIYAEWNAQVSRITLEGHSAGYNNMGYFNATQVFQYSGGLITQIRWGQSGGVNAYLDIYVASVINNNNIPINLCYWGDAWGGIQTSPAFNPAAGTTNRQIDVSQSGVLQARYDHQNRFVFSSNVGFSEPIAAGAQTFVAIFTVNIPSGKSLYLRRARFWLINTSLRLIVNGNANTFTSSDFYGDVVTNTLISPSGETGVSILIYNSSGTSQTIEKSGAYWLEFEIA